MRKHSLLNINATECLHRSYGGDTLQICTPPRMEKEIIDVLYIRRI